MASSPLEASSRCRCRRSWPSPAGDGGVAAGRRNRSSTGVGRSSIGSAPDRRTARRRRPSCCPRSRCRSADVPQTMFSRSVACPTRCSRAKLVPQTMFSPLCPRRCSRDPSPCPRRCSRSRRRRTPCPRRCCRRRRGAPDDVVAVVGRAPDDVLAVGDRAPDDVVARRRCPRRCSRSRRAERAPDDVVAVVVGAVPQTMLRPRRCRRLDHAALDAVVAPDDLRLHVHECG